ncbi:GH20871 [Drosophila grimshawi]|uniref:GH20871 n=1 Tax=Drosophila grimshawi TaxID=7222 RepID=B4J577_DROGR|nr:GH20871 [Drosophila grimshawi]
MRTEIKKIDSNIADAPKPRTSGGKPSSMEVYKALLQSDYAHDDDESEEEDEEEEDDEDDADFVEVKTEAQPQPSINVFSCSFPTEEQVEHNKAVAIAAMKRERAYTSQEQLHSDELMRLLARVYDFERGCLLDKTREPTVKPKQYDVPVVPPKMETVKVIEPKKQVQMQMPQQSRHHHHHHPYAHAQRSYMQH